MPSFRPLSDMNSNPLDVLYSIVASPLNGKAVPILLCFLLKIEKTNKYQIIGLVLSVLGILSIITKLNLEIILSLNFNKGDLIMIGGVISWGLYSAFLKKKKFDLPLLTLVHILCSLGLIFIFPQFMFEFVQGQKIEINDNQSLIVWQHSLPENLFGFASGNAQKLDNGNYLITTVGGNGTSIEVSSNGEEVWRGNYNLCEPICAVY